MTLTKRVERLEQALASESDPFIEGLVERVSRLSLEDRAAIIELMEADLAGEDVGATRPDTLAVLNKIIAEVQSDLRAADREARGSGG